MKEILIVFLLAWLLVVHIVLIQEKYALGYCVATVEAIAKQSTTKQRGLND